MLECIHLGMLSVVCNCLHWSFTPNRDSLIALLRHCGANRRRMGISHS